MPMRAQFDRRLASLLHRFELVAAYYFDADLLVGNVAVVVEGEFPLSSTRAVARVLRAALRSAYGRA